MPEITVLLPVYNGEKYLRESIDSVLAQSFRDFELHVLDDGSTDGSEDIVRSYDDPRVHFSKNGGRFGIFKTLNCGCRTAKTPWVRLWAQDDRMTGDSLETFYRFAQEHPSAGMVYSDFFDMDATGRLTGLEVEHQPQRDRTPDVADADTSALLFLVFGCLPGNISTVLLRRDVWDAVGGFREGIQQAPDYDMWVRISERYPVGFIRDHAVELRSHDLQMGRQGHKLMTLIEEEKMVFDQLRRRLVPATMTDAEFVWFWRSYKGRGHFHMTVRGLLRGQFATTARGLLAIRRYGSAFAQGWDWLRTANGRVGGLNRPAFYDTISARRAGSAK